MLLPKLSLILAVAPFALAQSNGSSDPFYEYTLTADNITAKFIGYGARLTSLLVPDRDGNEQDIVLGYDDPNQYAIDTATNHSYFGPVVGRYANRIKNGTFTVNGVASEIPTNEHNGANTLHGGSVGYDVRNWTVTAFDNSSITFQLVDDAFEGFPGTVITYATYTVSSETLGSYWGTPHPRLTSRIVSIALNSPTPIMLSNHIFWNLNGFSAPDILNDTTLWMPYSKRFIQTDGILIPNGTFGTVSSQPVLDFTKPKLLRDAIDDPSAQGICGDGCRGIDNAFLVDRPKGTGPEASSFSVLSLWSQNTGIRMDLATNQIGLQLYGCSGQNGTIPVKQSQVERVQAAGGEATEVVNKYGCLVIEPQAYIDGINHPEWGLTDYWTAGPSTSSVENWSSYDFTTF
jgi:aldose 1-epimerase